MAVFATITEPAELVIDTVITVSDYCGASQGQASVQVLGGTSAYSFNWNTNPIQSNATATGLIAGTYNITVSDANGCQVQLLIRPL